MPHLHRYDTDPRLAAAHAAREARMDRERAERDAARDRVRPDPGEVARLPAGTPSRILKLAEAVDHREADLEAARGQGPHVWADAEDRYADACHDLLEAVSDEARGIEEVLEYGYRITQHPLPAGAAKVADDLWAYADDLEKRRGL